MKRVLLALGLGLFGATAMADKPPADKGTKTEGAEAHGAKRGDKKPPADQPPPERQKQGDPTKKD
jgi:hypothetical protein